jgi:Xaa-Pro aminopeptidase
MHHGFGEVLAADLTLRCKNAQSAISEAGMDASLIHSNLNNLYLSGRIFAGFTYIPVEGDPLFFVRRPSGLSGKNVFEIRKPEQIPEILAEMGISPPERLGLESAELSHLNWQRLSAIWPGSEILNVSALLAEIRAVKTPYEITLMKKTGSRHVAVINQFASVYESGMTDQQWMTEMIGLMLKAGSLGIFRVAGESMEAFMGTVLAGDNGSAVSPYDFALGGSGMDPSYPVGQCGVKLEHGMAVMADIAANFYGYLTDCSRIFSIGKLSRRALDAHRLSIDIHSVIAERALPGVACEEIYNLAVAMADKAGFADCFMGGAQKAKFVGHGTGLVINELPVLGLRSRSILQEGMCIALEPKFVIPGAGAVGPEDTYLVTNSGLCCLTESSREIIEI